MHSFNYDGKILRIDTTEMLFLEGVIQVVFFPDRFYDMRSVVETPVGDKGCKVGQL